MPIQRKQSLWGKLPTTIAGHRKWRRSLQSQTDPETQKKRTELQIPCQMGWISNRQGLMGTKI